MLGARAGKVHHLANTEPFCLAESLETDRDGELSVLPTVIHFLP